MKRAMNDPAAGEAQHQEYVVFADPGFAGEKAGIAVEGDAGGGNGRLIVRRRHHGIDFAR